MDCSGRQRSERFCSLAPRIRPDVAHLPHWKGVRECFAAYLAAEAGMILHSIAQSRYLDDVYGASFLESAHLEILRHIPLDRQCLQTKVQEGPPTCASRVARERTFSSYPSLRCFLLLPEISPFTSVSYIRVSVSTSRTYWITEAF